MHIKHICKLKKKSINERILLLDFIENSYKTIRIKHLFLHLVDFEKLIFNFFN